MYYLIAFNNCCNFAPVLLWRLSYTDLTASKLIIYLKKKWTKNKALNCAEQRVKSLGSEDTAGEYWDDILVLDNLHQSIRWTSWRVTQLLHKHKHRYSLFFFNHPLPLSFCLSIHSFLFLFSKTRDISIRRVRWSCCNLNGGAEAKVSLFANTITTVYPAVPWGTSACLTS